jgi:tetratricopeptide (TPR) repeat protein
MPLPRTSAALRTPGLNRSRWRAAIVGFGLLAASLPAVGCRTFCPKSLEQNVVDARQASLQGLDAMQQGRWEEAERIFAGAVKSCPSDERARGCYAETLWRRGSRDEALGHMQEAARLSGGDSKRLVQLGEMHLALGQLDRAQQQADLALAKNNRLASGWALRGNVHLARGRLDEALADYHRSLAYCEHQPLVQMSVAQIYARQNRPQRALATLGTLAEQFPPGEVPVEVLAMQGMSLKQLGRPNDAVEMLAHAAALAAPSPELLFQLAEAQHLSGDASAAAASLDRALAQDPGHAAGLRLRGELTEKQQALTARFESGRVDSDRVLR